MDINMDPLQKQMLDDVFDAFTMLTANASFVSLMHVDGGFTRYSPSAVELLGLPGEYIENGAMDFNDYLHPHDRKRYMDVMLPLLDGTSQTYDITYRLRITTGEYVNFRAIGATLRGSDGKPSLIGGATFNEGIAQSTDPITVLPNKAVFYEDLIDCIADGKSAFTLMVGINRFTEINKTYGYTFGNRTLQEAAWVIQEVIGERGSVYRFDGARFGVLTDTLTREEVSAAYDMIRLRLQRGIEVNGIRNTLSASGALVSTAHTVIDPQTAYTCLCYAYDESKLHRHGDLVDFNGSVNYDETQSLELINTIRDCADNGCKGFSVEYLPVINALTDKPNGAEAVICWEGEPYGKVEAPDFLPVLVRDLLFEEVADFALEKSLADGVKFLEYDPGFLLCINTHRIQIESDYFIENLDHYLELTGFPPHLLSLKLDAECRYVEENMMRQVIDALHERNILVIVDDFGSGTNSIVFLKDMPVDAVCMDSQFTNGIETPGKDRDILEHLVKLACTCVEHSNIYGVDSKELREILRHYPFTTLQGEYFSGPISAQKMIEKYYA